MLTYIARRLVHAVAVTLVMSFVIYGMIGLMPGDPIDLMVTADPRITTTEATRLRSVYGLDQPLPERYLAWGQAALLGDFGYSRLYNRPVADALIPALGRSLVLMGLSFVLALSIALPAGILAARRPHSSLDYAINVTAFVGLSIPPFWLALVLILVFAVSLGMLPAGGTPITNSAGLADQLRYLVLPVAALTLASVGGLTRYIRAAMIEALAEHPIRTARAKGLSERQVIVGHALRRALLPVVTIIGLECGTLFSGALVTETVFAYPGMGRLIYDSIMGNDFNLALVALLMATIVTLLGNLLADLAYLALDPRITLTGGAQS